jgi:hypothetical protein
VIEELIAGSKMSAIGGETEAREVKREHGNSLAVQTK